VRLLRRELRRQRQGVEIARDVRRDELDACDALDGALHVGRALHEARQEIGWQARARALRVR